MMLNTSFKNLATLYTFQQLLCTYDNAGKSSQTKSSQTGGSQIPVSFALPIQAKQENKVSISETQVVSYNTVSEES